MSYWKLSCFFLLFVCVTSTGWWLTFVFIYGSNGAKYSPHVRLFLTLSRAAEKPAGKHS
jgi:hypothetical protein